MGRMTPWEGFSCAFRVERIGRIRKLGSAQLMSAPRLELEIPTNLLFAFVQAGCHSTLWISRKFVWKSSELRERRDMKKEDNRGVT